MKRTTYIAGPMAGLPNNNHEAFNVAATREALEKVHDYLLKHPYYVDEEGMMSMVIDALSAPPRNCDIYNSESCRMAYHMHGDGIMTLQAFADWLFAEHKGKAKK